ncbi:MAG: ATP-binding protein, partial [Pseudomonadales bacterium]|nr:ATP-binding protein [Pseudomonadales bacterium]
QNDLMSYAAMELTIEPYVGYVLIAEQGRDRYVMLTASNFLTFLITLIAISILVVSITFIAMNRWSNRLATLNDNAQRHVDEKGDITGDFDADASHDEIGQLSRNVGDLLGQIKNHNDYLKTLAQKLSHEMRTPLAIVSTSLDNIDNKSDSNTASQEANGNDVYLTRARDGIQRLNHIMTAMGQAKKIEQAIEHAELISFDIVELLQEACQSYQSVYDKNPIIFSDMNKAESLTVNASADLMIQMLDKLVDNAVGFSEEGSAVNIHLITSNDFYEIQVVNMGSQLPEKDVDGLFQQLVSYRSKGDDKPHLGLGLFIARLITEYHRGTISAANLENQSGVSFNVKLPLK